MQQGVDSSGTTERNQEVFNRVGDSYTDMALKPAERMLLRRLGHDLTTMDMLELGVGSGRLGYTFAPLVRSYVGLDYAPEMLERAKHTFEDDDNVTLVLGDARDLPWSDRRFDLVVFPFNGIDAVAYDDRLQVMQQVRSVLRPGGWFMFSSHSTGALPLVTSKAHSPWHLRTWPRRTYVRLRDLRYAVKVRQVNQRVDLAHATRMGWVLVPGFGHDFQVDDVYVDPGHQVEMLRRCDFTVHGVYDVRGRPIELDQLPRDPWFHYLCQLSDGVGMGPVPDSA